jgi:hypothetical protein
MLRAIFFCLILLRFEAFTARPFATQVRILESSFLERGDILNIFHCDIGKG